MATGCRGGGPAIPHNRATTNLQHQTRTRYHGCASFFRTGAYTSPQGNLALIKKSYVLVARYLWPCAPAALIIVVGFSVCSSVAETLLQAANQANSVLVSNTVAACCRGGPLVIVTQTGVQRKPHFILFCQSWSFVQGKTPRCGHICFFCISTSHSVTATDVDLMGLVPIFG